jgi:hypothetical protein
MATTANIEIELNAELVTEINRLRQQLANERTLTDMLAGAIMREYSPEDALKRYREGLANDYDKARVSVFLSNAQTLPTEGAAKKP